MFSIDAFEAIFSSVLIVIIINSLSSVMFAFAVVTHDLPQTLTVRVAG